MKRKMILRTLGSILAALIVGIIFLPTALTGHVRADGPNEPILRLLPVQEMISAPAAPEAPAAIVRYVDALATGSKSGTSWANAYTDLAAAIAASSPGTHLWIAEGRYTPHATDRTKSFVLKNGVSLYGGFPTGGGDGTMAARFPAGHPTILTGNINNTLLASDNSYHVVTAVNVSSEVVLDGVTIADGRADQGSNTVAGGLLLRNSVVVLRNCVIRNNYGVAGTPALRAESGGSLIMEDCRVSDNQTADQGSAIILAGTQTTIERTIFTDNSAASFIGPIWIQNSPVTVRNTVVVNNSNGANGYAAILVAGGHVDLNHVTIAGHTEKAVLGSDSAQVSISNSILWGNGAPEIINTSGATTSVDSSVVQGGYAGGTNVLTTDPLFWSSSDFRLGNSPAKDGANRSACPIQDILGYPRPNGNGCDMGAYEMFNSWTFCSNPERTIPDNSAAGLPDSLTVLITGTILDVDLFLNVTHPFVGDLSASLTHLGNGQTQTVLTRPQKADGGPCTGDNVGAWMDDASATPVDDTCNISPPAIGGRVAPSNPLALFNNTVLPRPSIWFLNIRDNEAGDVGTLLSWCVQLTMAESRIVTRLDDPVPDGCQIGDCSLREAIITANASPQSESIIFAVDGIFTLSQAGRDEEQAATGDLDITGDLTITGNGPDKTIIDGGAIDRVFDVYYPSRVTLSDLTIQNGLSSDVPGGGVEVYASQVHLLRTVLRNNHVPNGTGGALANLFGRLVLEESAVYGNSASFIGALYTQEGDTEIINSSIFGNTGSSGSVSNFSGIGNDASTTMTIRNSTIVPGDNSLAINNNAIGGSSATVMLQNSIFSAPSTHCRSLPDDGTATITSLGHNIAGDDSCNLTATGDQPNTNARLAPPTDNGGPTPTLALLPGSPALDAGDDVACPVNDQRGLPRLDRDGNSDGGGDVNRCDIGAYEAQTVPRSNIYLPLLVK